ncbi:tetratricopeptide repeat protein [Burkholderia ambifaria]|uniref:tetratricopeptide repeat protein n=1 Tax=Burkholderia ambifaria TaxID=152480 RepID=UPI001589BA01|nr:tetratricopeptide repeat protein [Burkholderia ambifaria]
MNATPPSANDRVLRLLSYLAIDPLSRSIRIDLAHAAFDANQHDVCDRALDELQQESPHSSELLNLAGLNALARGNPEQAIEALRAIPASERNAVVQYNIAYALALLEKYEEALVHLTDRVLAALPEAVALRIRTLHHLNRLDEAVSLGAQHADTQPELAAPLAVALFDMGNSAAARRYAQRAGDSPDAWTILALLDLERGATDSAEQNLTKALQKDPTHVRATLGMGLVRMAQQRFEAAAQLLDAAAQSFRNHAGSWLASGWAYLYHGDLITSRKRFEQAEAIDRSFAEVHGSLAVLDCREGLLAAARRRADTALRLDPASLSAALANSLLQSSANDHEQAQRTIEVALQMPIGSDGPALMTALSLYLTSRQEKTPRKAASLSDPSH